MQNNAQFKVYQASAGAGKTFTLIKEYLKLCLASQKDVDNYRHILAITFTNAAANEMKAKIVKDLRKIIDSATVDPKSMEANLIKELGISDAELKRNAQSLMTKIMHDYSNFCVCTIDAFVQKLSRSFAHDLGLPSKYTVSIDTEEVAEAVTEYLGLRISDGDAYLSQLLRDFSNNQFENQRSTAIEDQLAEFVAKLMTEKAYQKDENNGIQDDVQYGTTLHFLNGKIQSFERSIKGFVQDFRSVEQRFALTVEDYWRKSSGVSSFIGKLEKKEYVQPNSYFHTAISKRRCLSDTSKNDVEDALLKVLEPLEAFYEKEYGKFLFYNSQRNLLYLYALRTQIRMAINQLTRDEEVVHISEFNKLLNSVMGDFSVPFVYERIGEHFRHVFVDEFQDTSVLQWQNLLPLVDNGLASGNMSMVVGDGKQSIYRFRSGEVEQIASLPEVYAMPHDEREDAFMQFEQKLKSCYAFENLGTNYRSFENVVEFNNAFFEVTYKQLDQNSQKVYVNPKPVGEEGAKIHQEHDIQEKGLVQVELYDAESQPDYCLGRIEAIIRELVDNRGYRYEDITVLTRKTEYGSRIANYLNDRGISVISQVSILLKSSNEVQLLVNTLRYLTSRDNETFVANVLNYWNLIHPRVADGDITHWFDKVKSVAGGDVAIETVMGIGDSGLLDETLAKATCLYDLCASLIRVYGMDTIRDSFLNYFMEEVFKSQLGIKEGIADFLLYWDKKQDKLAVMSASGDAVNIMTIHKSKGLEFPVVIYPDAIIDLDEKLNPKVAEEWLLPKQDLGFDDIPNLEKVLFKLDTSAEEMGSLANARVVKEKNSNRLDNLNLLYVAFTRAVQRLYVIAKQGKADKTNIIRDFLKDKDDHQVVGNEASVYRFGDPDFRNPKEKTEKEVAPTLTDSTSMDWFQRVSVDADPTSLWRSASERLQPREWGELVHQILSRIRYPQDVDVVLKPYLSSGTIDQETAIWIQEMFQQMSSHPLIAPAFAPMAKVKTECEILYQGDVKRLDRYAEIPDAIYLLDYKTGMQGKKHHEQVQQYAAALKELVDKEIRAFLVYLDETGIEVEPVSVG